MYKVVGEYFGLERRTWKQQRYLWRTVDEQDVAGRRACGTIQILTCMVRRRMATTPGKPRAQGFATRYPTQHDNLEG